MVSGDLELRHLDEDLLFRLAEVGGEGIHDEGSCPSRSRGHAAPRSRSAAASWPTSGVRRRGSRPRPGRSSSPWSVTVRCWACRPSRPRTSW
ncbi:hypothetical protein NKG05_08865 [Oerskovia sp. M15]